MQLNKLIQLSNLKWNFREDDRKSNDFYSQFYFFILIFKINL